LILITAYIFFSFLLHCDSLKMSGNGAREKALQFLREVPRLSNFNVRGLPKVAGIENRITKKRGRGQQGFDQGWGSSARQKLYYGPLGYESGSSPIQRKTTFERSYNYGLRFQVLLESNR